MVAFQVPSSWTAALRLLNAQASLLKTKDLNVELAALSAARLCCAGTCGVCYTGVDMTPAQLEVAQRYANDWATQLGYASPNMRFVQVLRLLLRLLLLLLLLRLLLLHVFCACGGDKSPFAQWAMAIVS